MKKEHKVFVYGTLKQGNPIRGLDRVSGSTFISSAITTDAKDVTKSFLLNILYSFEINFV
jgi:gamma-glutamylcyclotransferase (GGCT)/AIG2-like uncharacterized protein YtfP